MKYLFIILISIFLFSSCSRVTGIIIINNTNQPIIIECKTIYDMQSDNVREYNKIYMRYLQLNTSYLLVLAENIKLSNKEETFLLGKRGNDVINELGYGTIDSINDVITAIDHIFLEINIYLFNDNEKTLLYNKNYFLNDNNIIINNRHVLLIIN